MRKRQIFNVATFGLVIFLATGCSNKSTFIYVEDEAKIQDLITSVTATGTIEPVTSVDVGTQVSGIVSRIYVDFNSNVKAGEVIAELDKTNLLSELSSAEANLKSAQSDLDYQRTNHERLKNLFEKGLISSNDYEQARLAFIKAQQTVANYKENVRRAQTNLGYATITSPIDGVVLSKEVEEGQTVASSFNTPTLFKIAKDLTDMRVIANVDEADIGNVKQGQRVEFSVDAFPEDIFQGTVSQVRQQATIESNVVTYEVVISAPNNDLKLKPGLTANITIFTLEMEKVLTVPSKALKYKPNEAMLNEGESIQDTKEKEKVWVKDGSVIKAVGIKTGANNGPLAQVITGLKAGTKVITDVQSSDENAAEEEQEQGSNNPFMPRRNNNRRR